jgi:hypothetical protein
MNYIPQRLQIISESLHFSEMITNPEKFFGPNYKTLINFWIWTETNVSPSDCYGGITSDAWDTVYENAIREFGKYPVVYLYVEEMEITAAHSLIETGQLFFLPALIASSETVH